MPIGVSFGGGDEPGDVHPGCRCVSTMLFHPLRLRPGSDTPGHYTGLDDEEAA